MKVNQAIKTGFVTAALSIAMMIGVIYAPHGNATAFFQYGALIVFLSGTYVAIKRTRDRELGGAIEFKLGLKAGVTSGALAAVLMSTFQFIAWTHIDVHEFANEIRINGGVDSDVLNQLRAMTRDNFMKAASLLACVNIIISLFVSVAGTLLLRKKGGLLNQ